ncbi:hypothetical protein ABDF71_22765 [Ochrobactrum sp. WV_118_8]|uniref:hypothetical protein n=1 Tax=Brucella anthropi TaxID=529 RepID=UPI002158484A|nr:hypothetical protein [Brucella anthropi]MCR8492776.1 hypothetical protein [Brucella anthropi]
MNTIKWFYAACAAYVFAIYTLTQTWPVSLLIHFVSYMSQQEEVWWREWIGALSGWAGAIGALVAAGWTISHLRKQISDQRRQTDFILGNTDPSFELSIDSAISAGILVQNFNRRRVEIVSVTNLTPFQVKMYWDTNKDIGYFKPGETRTDFPDRQFVDGNIRPDHAPPCKLIKFNVKGPHPESGTYKWQFEFKVKFRSERGTTRTYTVVDHFRV